MKQRWWLELMTDYDINLQYHPSKVNVVLDALNMKHKANLIVKLTQ